LSGTTILSKDLNVLTKGEYIFKDLIIVASTISSGNDDDDDDDDGVYDSDDRSSPDVKVILYLYNWRLDILWKMS